MTLQALIQAVKEEHLTREQLEAYGDQLSGLFAQFQMEIAELEKMEARYPMENFKSAIERKNNWKATPAGQRLIELKRYAIATKELINSLKSRVYRLIY